MTLRYYEIAALLLLIISIIVIIENLVLWLSVDSHSRFIHLFDKYDLNNCLARLYIQTL